MTTPETPRAAPANQCDGCRRGLPLRASTFGGAPIHYNPDGSYDSIGCTAHLYHHQAAPAAPATTPRHTCACGRIDEASGYVWPADHHPNGCAAPATTGAPRNCSHPTTTGWQNADGSSGWKCTACGTGMNTPIEINTIGIPDVLAVQGYELAPVGTVAAIASSRAEVEALRRERDEARFERDEAVRLRARAVEEESDRVTHLAQQDIAALAAERDAIREALRGLADEIDYYWNRNPLPVEVQRALARARTALAEHGG